MPITINGTTVTTNKLNGTSISNETLNGTKVYGVRKVWYYYLYESSMPSTSTPYTGTNTQASYPSRADIENTMTGWYPPADIPLGTTGWIYYSNSGIYFSLMVIEE